MSKSNPCTHFSCHCTTSKSVTVTYLFSTEFLTAPFLCKFSQSYSKITKLLVLPLYSNMEITALLSLYRAIKHTHTRHFYFTLYTNPDTPIRPKGRNLYFSPFLFSGACFESPWLNISPMPQNNPQSRQNSYNPNRHYGNHDTPSDRQCGKIRHNDSSTARRVTLPRVTRFIFYFLSSFTLAAATASISHEHFRSSPANTTPLTALRSSNALILSAQNVCRPNREDTTLKFSPSLL